jgi:hypothetical protein
MNNTKKEPQIYSQFNNSDVYGYKVAKDNTPILFKKKIKKGFIKPLKHIYSDTGKTRHFTPAAQE